MKHHIVDAPYHILTGIRILQSQPQVVQYAISPYVKSSAWYAHSECLLLSLLASSNPTDRSFAVDKILALRGNSVFGSTKVRDRKTPDINMKASSLINLIDWDQEPIYEPSFTCALHTEQMRGFLTTPYIPPKFTCHTQSTERCVKLVSEAAAEVCGQEAREGYILAKLHHREKIPVCTTKRHLMEKL